MAGKKSNLKDPPLLNIIWLNANILFYLKTLRSWEFH